MWRVALRDLQWRRRRFVIALLATSLVFDMTLLMAGFATSLHNEGRRIVAALGADAWLVAPPLATGRAVARAGEMVADTELGLAVGDRLELSGRRLEVVGLADQVTWYFGTPTLFLALEDAQAVAFGGQPLAMAVLTRGTPAGGAAGLERFSNEQAVADLERPLVRGSSPSTSSAPCCGWSRPGSSARSCTCRSWSGCASWPCSRW
jgi:putative ABC transport system permease protein